MVSSVQLHTNNMGDAQLRMHVVSTDTAYIVINLVTKSLCLRHEMGKFWASTLVYSVILAHRMLCVQCLLIFASSTVQPLLPLKLVDSVPCGRYTAATDSNSDIFVEVFCTDIGGPARY